MNSSRRIKRKVSFKAMLVILDNIVKSLENKMIDP